MQKLIIALLLFSSILYLQYQGDDDDIPPGIYDSFTHYEKDFSKVYETPQIRSYRLHVFYKNVLFIADFMDDFDVTFFLDYTPFTDMTTEEFQTIYLQNLTPPVYAQEELKVFKAENLKDSVDWRASGIVSDVGVTGACSSTWAFSTTGVIESSLRQKGQKGLNLSEQQLLDCSNDAVYTQGCAGGWPKQAYQWVSRNGAVTEAEYPYVGKQQTKCSKFTGTIKPALFDVVKPDKTGLNLKIAVNKRPVSVCFDASYLAMYVEGTVNKYCDGKPNVCGLLVGYDDSGWIVKMPWGTLWGEDGYVNIDPAAGCGLYDHALVPQD